MLILGIESSCDETACAVVRDGREVLSNVVASQIEEHRLYGGVVPEIASRRHAEAISQIYRQALEEAGVPLEEIGAVAVTYAPGLIGCLLVGLNFAKGLAYSTGKPLVPVHHLRGHIAANYIAHPDLQPPFLCLVVSGGHSHIIEVLSYTAFRVVGRTLDDAAGEAFDKAARTLGFPYPGGIALDRAAQRGDKGAFSFPTPKVAGKYDFSFSGLKTAVINTAHNAAQRGAELPVADICASFQEKVADILCHNLLAAARDLGYKTLAVAGGVSANSGLRGKLSERCREEGLALYLPPLSLCGDNGAMIASQGYYEYCAGNLAGLGWNAVASLPIDLVG